jgi:hypothetical protein
MKTIAYFDIETNGITDWSTLSDLKDLHCLVIIDQYGTWAYRSNTVQEGLARLSLEALRFPSYWCVRLRSDCSSYVS